MRLGVAAAVVDGALVRGDVEVADGVVRAVGLAGGGSGLAIPGLVDLQVNGYAGVDVARAEADVPSASWLRSSETGTRPSGCCVRRCRATR